MKNNFYIFFSWQSDVPGNKRFIDKKIKDAKAEILAMPEMAGVTTIAKGFFVRSQR